MYNMYIYIYIYIYNIYIMTSLAKLSIVHLQTK